jgi:AcrR family transcriptional regulator
MRHEILDSASHLINLGGVEHVTMRTLGREVGVTAATLYGYFPSKEAVLEALLEEKMLAMNRALEQAAKGTEPGAPRLLAYAMGYRQFAMTSPDFYSMFIIKLEPPDWENLASADDERSVVLSNIHREIQHAIDAGDMYPLPPDAVCRVFWSFAHGYVTLERSGCFDTSRLGHKDQEKRYLDHILLASRGLFTPQRLAELTANVDVFVETAGEE